VATFTQLVEQGDSAPALAARLGEVLLRPAVATLPAEVTHLVIVPDKGLYRLPFDALIVGSGQTVLERFVTSQLPSATLLVRLRRIPPRQGTALLAFGDPARGAGDDAVIRAALGDIGLLHPLPGARSEARGVARYAPQGIALVGRAATETALKRLAPRQRVLHFAVHAVVNDLALTRTALLLAPSEEDDGIVVPGEVAALRLDADLVVLSACRTASGVMLAGEGVRGLIAPFLEAGTRAVVGSTWEVGDRGARIMMGKLYDGLADGLAVGPALRRARIEARREGLPPRLWAGFVLTGDPGVVLPLRRPRSFPRLMVLLAAAVIGGAWWFWSRSRASRSHTL
jgi:CHAT domain-containing protein